MQTTTMLRKGDVVQVLSGRSKGKSGKILRISQAKARVFLEGVNTVKAHQKPSQQNPQGGIVDKEASIHWSSVQIVCNTCAKPVRVKMANLKGKRQRVCGKCQTPVASAAL